MSKSKYNFYKKGEKNEFISTVSDISKNTVTNKAIEVFKSNPKLFRQLQIEECFKLRIIKSLRVHLAEQSFQRASFTESIRVGSPTNDGIIDDIIAGSLGTNGNNSESLEKFHESFGNK